MSKPYLITGVSGLLKRNKSLGVAVFVSLLAVLYWGLFASDRYLSEAHVVIQNTGASSTSAVPDLGALLKGGHTGGPADQLLLRDHLLSTDMLKILDAKLSLRAHYSDRGRDLLSRLWYRGDTLEAFHDYYLDRVSIEYNDYAGVLVIRAQAFDPATAHATASLLVSEGEAFMNGMARDLAREQVDFLEKDIQRIGKDTLAARQAVLDFQNQHGLVSPENATENVTAIINHLEAQLADLQTTRAGMLGYLMPDSANIRELSLQIDAVEKQIAREQAKLTSPTSKTLNRTVEAYQRLQMQADFAQEIYKAALTSLEQGRYEAARTLKKMAVLQTPTLPEYPVEPRRVYNTAVFILTILLVAGILHLVAAIIRDHKD
jgi:capsular polysaccharide transport system permease protein